MIKVKDKIIYALGNLSNGIVLQALTTYLVFFGTSILGISGTLIGLMIGISVVWDALSDPLVGHMSDFTTSKRFGRRHQYMIVGALGLTLFNGLLWSIDVEWSTGTKAIMLFVIILLLKTFMTIFVTPYNALGGELSDDYYERTSIQAYRTVFFTSGLAFTTVAGMILYFKPSQAYPVGQLNPIAYRNLGLTISVIIIVCAGLAIYGTFKFIGELPKNTKPSTVNRLGDLIKEFKGLFNNKNYLYVAGAYLSANIATAIFGAVGLHLFTYTFRMSNVDIGVLFAFVFGGCILSQGFWITIAKKRDKKSAAILAVRISLIGAMLMIALVIYKEVVAEHFWMLVLYGIPTGIGLGGLITLPFSMIADTVDEEELKTSYRFEGLFYGGLTFSYKISQSIAILLVGIILDLLGFEAALEVQSETTQIGLGVLVVVGSIVALLGALHFYKKYGLTKERSDEIKHQIMMRKTQK